jgi:hypothetical protein
MMHLLFSGREFVTTHRAVIDKVGIPFRIWPEIHGGICPNAGEQAARKNNQRRPPQRPPQTHIRESPPRRIVNCFFLPLKIVIFPWLLRTKIIEPSLVRSAKIVIECQQICLALYGEFGILWRSMAHSSGGLATYFRVPPKGQAGRLTTISRPLKNDQSASRPECQLRSRRVD